jgi:hypothetical protein
MALAKAASSIALPWPYNDDTFFKKFYYRSRHFSAAWLQSSDLPELSPSLCWQFLALLLALPY